MLDLQVNGFAGVDFNASNLTPEQLHAACEALQAEGAEQVLVTLITDTIEALEKKLKQLHSLCVADELAQRIVAGFHVEGPFLNPAPGYIGAHNPQVVKLAQVDDAKRLLDAGGGWVRLCTLAPEMDPYNQTTRFLCEQNVVVSAGHCNPSLEQLKGAIDNGLSMMTHLGNGCPVNLPRHDNIIQRVLHFREQLWISFIPDGAHIEFYALKNYLDLVGVERTIMVTDAISAAGLGPGIHQLADMTVEVDNLGVARKPRLPNLAGSTLTPSVLRQNLSGKLKLLESDIRKMIEENPRQALEQAKSI